MPKSSKKTAPKVEVVAAAATTPKPLKKGKRQPEEATEKKLSNKKQKNEVGAQGVIVKEVGEKNQKKKKNARKTQKKNAVKKQESSDVSPSSDSEEEHKLGASAKNGPVSDSEKIEESGSEDEDINDSDENVNPSLAGSEKKEEASEDGESDDDDVESDDDDVESDVDEVSDAEMVDVTTKPNAEKKSSEKKKTKTSLIPSQASGSKTLFIGNLSFSVEKADVENLFEDYGDLVDVRLGVRADGSSRGFGHVEFATAEAAQKALEEKNGQDLQGRPVRLDVAAEKGAHTPQSSKDASSHQKGSGGRTIYVRGFDKSSEEDDIKKALREYFSTCGEVTRISVPSDDDGGCKGFAYIDFTNNDAVTSAQELDQSTLDGYTLTVEEAKPRGDGASGGRFSGGRGGGRGGGGRSGGRRGGGRFGGRGGGGRGGGGRGGGGRGRGRGSW